MTDGLTGRLRHDAVHVRQTRSRCGRMAVARNTRLTISAIGRVLLSAVSDTQLGLIYKSICTSSPISGLPCDLLFIVASFVSKATLCRMFNVCSAWRRSVRAVDEYLKRHPPTVEMRLTFSHSAALDVQRVRFDPIDLNDCDGSLSIHKAVAGIGDRCGVVVDVNTYYGQSDGAALRHWTVVSIGPSDICNKLRRVMDDVGLWKNIVITGLRETPMCILPTEIPAFQSVRTIEMKLDQWIASCPAIRVLQGIVSVEISVTDKCRCGSITAIPGHPTCTELILRMDTNPLAGGIQLSWSQIDIGAEWKSVHALRIVNAGAISDYPAMNDLGSVLKDVYLDDLLISNLTRIPASLIQRVRGIRPLHLCGWSWSFPVCLFRMNPRHMTISLKVETIRDCADYFSNCGWQLESLSIIFEYGVVLTLEDVSERMEDATKIIRCLHTDCLTTVIIIMAGWLDGREARVAQQVAVHRLIRYCIKTCSGLRELWADYRLRDEGCTDPDEIVLPASTLGRHGRLKRLELEDCVVIEDEADFINRFPRLECVRRTSGERRMIGRQCALGGRTGGSRLFVE